MKVISFKHRQYKLPFPPLLVPRRQAMALLGIQSDRTFNRRIHEGALTPVSVGKGHPMFRMSDIKRLAGERL